MDNVIDARAGFAHKRYDATKLLAPDAPNEKARMLAILGAASKMLNNEQLDSAMLTLIAHHTRALQVLQQTYVEFGVEGTKEGNDV